MSTVYFGTSAHTWKVVSGGGITWRKHEEDVFGVFEGRRAGSGDCSSGVFVVGWSFFGETFMCMTFLGRGMK